MKRLWCLVALIGMMAMFAMQASAVDLKLTGEYYVAGIYQDKVSLKKNFGSDGLSSALYYQRLRLQTDFVVSKGLILITRMDVMERAWGATRSAPGSTNQTAVGTSTIVSSGTAAENENIAFDYCYIMYYSPIGRFKIGIQQDTTWGTEFGDDSKPGAGIGLLHSFKNGFYINFKLNKNKESSYSAVNTAANYTDGDNNAGSIALFYIGKDFEAGILYKHFIYKYYRPLPGYGGLHITYREVSPYAKVRLGPVFLQTELNYINGMREYESPSVADQRETPLSFWIDGTADLGMFYVGGSFAYVSGDDPGTNNIEGGTLTGGIDYSPCLLMFNYDRTNWIGSLNGYSSVFKSKTITATMNNPLSNAYFFQLRGGIKPMDNLNIMASVSYANADKKPTPTWLYNDYGYEVDLTATYAVTKNLSYMMGAGYFITGKYFKAEQDSNDLHNDYVLMHKLTLTF